MKLKDILLLLLVAVVWGFNFVPIKIGLSHLPPFTMAMLRFLCSAFPAVFFVKKPDVPFGKLAIYGCVMFAAQFSFMFAAVHMGFSAGLASLVVQTQAFFTIGISMLLFGERPQLFQIIGALVAACGIVVVGIHVGGDVSLLGLVLVMCGALCWGAGNVMTKSLGKVDMFGVVVWGSFFACVPLLFLSVILERNAIDFAKISADRWPIIFAVGYNAYISSFIGYTLWNRMLARHPAVLVAPFSLLVPGVAMLSASLFLGETYTWWKFEATVLVLFGLGLNQFGGKLVNAFKKPLSGDGPA